MEGLTALLLFSGLFYVLMRFACGADVVHRRRSPESGQYYDASNLDPVCCRPVELRAELATVYHGKLYRFCSQDCLEILEGGPDRYMSTAQSKAGNKSAARVEK